MTHAYRRGAKRLQPVLLAFILSLLGGCAWLQSLEEQDETADWTPAEFFNAAKEELSSNNYEGAVELLEKLQARYPFGAYAQQAQLELIYAHYRNEQPDLAIAAADRFIRTHPRHPYVDYAYYLKGLTNFDRGVGVLEKLFPSDPSKTDTSSALQSFNDFAELVQKFPDSRYAEDSQQRMLFLRNNLAAYEIHVADYYMRRKAYVAAANRGKYVLENFSSTPAVVDALAIMTQAYLKLDMPELAADSLRVLQANYPSSPQFASAQALVEGREPPAAGDEDDSLLGWLF